jgi:hypothetical protein
VHRHLLDRIATLFHRVHRYRCSSLACGWEGLFESRWRSAHAARSLPALATPDGQPVYEHWSDHALWFACGVLATVLTVAAVDLTKYAQTRPGADLPRFDPALNAVTEVPPGESHDGLEMGEDDWRAEGNDTKLKLRRVCSWGIPGRNPYQGTVSEALSAARLPDDVVDALAAKVKAGQVTDHVLIDRNRIRAERTGRIFSPTLPAMAYGNSLCFNTKVNFSPGHTERADVYEVRDRIGAKYTIMVPYVCGNVAVLDERIERNGGNGTAPEPFTWVLVVTGLGAFASILYLRPSRVESGK